MSNEHNKTRHTVYISPDNNDRIDAILAIDNSLNNRSDVINKAIMFYKGYLDQENSQGYIAGTLKNILDGSLAVYFDRLNRNSFKEAVETSIMCRLLAKSFDIDEETYQSIRRIAVEDVKRNKGTISIYDAQK